jgi:MoCo/4Fe-4S cofactor protein with predicted Tat translocation signal
MSPMKPNRNDSRSLDFKTIRGNTACDRQQARSLEEIAKTPEFEEFLRSEYPAFAGLPEQDIGRRRFLQLMGASLALAM